MNFEGKSIAELEALRVQIDALIEQKKLSNKKALQEKLVALARESGFSLDELFDSAPAASKSKASKSKSAAKSEPMYVDKATGNTYGGRGPHPGWLKQKIAEGHKLEEFKV